MEKIDLIAQPRAEAATPNTLRSQGFIPAVVYGKGENPLSLQVAFNDFQKAYKLAGENTIINLQISGSAPKMVLVKDVQVSPDKGDYIHIDFYKIKAGEKLKVAIPLNFIGEAPAVKDFEGIVITNKNEVEVECLPQDLPREIEVDLSKLINIDDTILVKDLIVSAGVEIMDDAEESVVIVAPPAAEEVEPEVSEADAIASVEATEQKPEGEGEEEAKSTDKEE